MYQNATAPVKGEKVSLKIHRADLVDRKTVFQIGSWRREKGGVFNYHVWFDDWWARDIAAMVLRDRNHPCVLSYSIGNEIPESDGLTDGDIWSARLVNEVRKYDAKLQSLSVLFLGENE